MAARVYQAVIEVVAITNPNARVYQAVIEVISGVAVAPHILTYKDARSQTTSTLPGRQTRRVPGGRRK